MSLKLSDYEREMFYPNTELLDLEYQKRKDEDGVSIDISNDEFLGILTYTKNHYDEAVSFFREIGDNKDVFHYFLNFSNPIFRPKGLQRIRFYKFMLDHFAIMSYLKGYTTGFKMVEHMDSYHDVMMQIFGYLNDASADDRKEYFDRAISNIEELKKLVISDVKIAIGYPKNSEFRMGAKFYSRLCRCVIRQIRSKLERQHLYCPCFRNNRINGTEWVHLFGQAVWRSNSTVGKYFKARRTC